MRKGILMRAAIMLCLIMVLLLGMTPVASGVDTPKTMNVQGRLTDVSDNPVPAGDWIFNFKIYDAELSGTGAVVWPDSDGEYQIITTDDDGLWNALIGAVKPLAHDVFSDTVRWLEISVQTETEPPNVLPRIRLVTGPFAYRVGTIDGASGGTIYSKVSIGTGHTNTGSSAFVAGSSNSVTGPYTAVSGGTFNDASGDWSIVGGGYSNIASGNTAFVGGGSSDTADGYRTAIAAGEGNRASGSWSTVSGGYQNKAIGTGSTVGGGGVNKARGKAAVVAGGGQAPGSGSAADSNAANGDYSIIPGGRGNVASGDYSFAAGRNARSVHTGSFVWADSHTGILTSTANNQFSLRAIGGYRLYTNTALSSGVLLASGGGAWASASDRSIKENVRPVDNGELLEKIAQLEISRWNYETQDPSIEHIGPMAQDFYRLFGVGDNDKTISTIDPDGIALAAIQELEKRTKRIDQLESELTELRRLVLKLTEERE